MGHIERLLHQIERLEEQGAMFLEEGNLQGYLDSQEHCLKVRMNIAKERENEQVLWNKLERARMTARCPCCNSRVYGERDVKKLTKWLDKNTTNRGINETMLL